MAGSCEHCKKAPPAVNLERCAKCQTTEYCSRECQKNNWKQHKKVCASQASTSTPRPPGVSSVNHTGESLSPPKGCEAIYGGMENGLEGLVNFIQEAEEIGGLLPSWWGPEKRQECGAYGMRDNRDNFCNLRHTVAKADIIKHYGDPQFPMQLRMLAEAIYGSGPGGQNASSTRQMLAAMEGGGFGWPG